MNQIKLRTIIQLHRLLISRLLLNQQLNPSYSLKLSQPKLNLKLLKILILHWYNLSNNSINNKLLKRPFPKNNRIKSSNNLKNHPNQQRKLLFKRLPKSLKIVFVKHLKTFKIVHSCLRYVIDLIPRSKYQRSRKQFQRQNTIKQ